MCRALFYLIFVNVPRQFSLAQLVEGNDDQSDEDVDKKEREDNEVDDIENGHFHPEHRDRAFVFIGRGHGVLKKSGENSKSLLVLSTNSTTTNYFGLYYTIIAYLENVHPAFGGLYSK